MTLESTDIKYADVTKLLKMTDMALSKQHVSLITMRHVIKSLRDSNDTQDREALDKEFQSHLPELSRIAERHQSDVVNLLDGHSGPATFAMQQGMHTFDFKAVLVDAESLGVAGLTIAGAATEADIKAADASVKNAVEQVQAKRGGLKEMGSSLLPN
ncbi:flagellin N-terminal helical domain-containing protein [Streptomyces xanthophaeus]